MRYLNLGCGRRIHPDWENVDFTATAPRVRAHDLRKGIPYPDATFDVVYHSHVLEHFSKQSAPAFLRECHRVLKSRGTIRIAVPDLERIVRMYLATLEKSVSGDGEARSQYDWAIIEMYDQAVRRASGGEMLAFVRTAPASQIPFLKARLGGEFDRMTSSHDQPRASTTLGRAFADGLRRRILRLLFGREGIAAFDLGRFQLSGEIHQWMYDRYSLRKALDATRFTEIQQVGAAESRIPGWASFHLDAEPDSAEYKPDSLFMEASRQ